MYFSGTFFRNLCERVLFIFIFFKKAIKMMCPSNFQKFPTFSMCCKQSTNKIAANDSQIKPTICDL